MSRIRTVIEARPVRSSHVLAGQLVLNLAHRTISTSLGRVRLTPKVFQVALVLCARQGGVVAMDDLIDFLYGDDPDGGPVTAEKLVHMYVMRTRKALPDIGLRVRTLWGRGWFIESAGTQVTGIAA